MVRSWRFVVKCSPKLKVTFDESEGHGGIKPTGTKEIWGFSFFANTKAANTHVPTSNLGGGAG